MQLKYLQTLLQAQDQESKICALAWAPNNLKLAVATADRQILLYDETGERRDKFPTKPSDPASGKKSYVVRGLAFSPDSTKLAVAQSDRMVFVYKLGEGWGEKKAICNKFSQPASVTTLLWLTQGPIICGLSDGKVRALQTKSNKSQSLYASESFVISLVANSRGTGFLSGHVDGTVVRYYVSEDIVDSEPQGRVLVHPVPPYALAWPQGQVLIGGCDKRVMVYNGMGKMMKQFDFSRDDSENEFTVACCSPSGQAVAVGSFNRVRIFTWSPRKSAWEESPPKEIANFYTVTALSWKRDGSRMACGSLCGAVFLFESVLRRTVWKDKFELTFVGPSQVLVKPLDTNERGVVLRSQLGREIDDVRIMGKDKYLVARTEDTLLIGDLQRNLLSEVAWNSVGHHEKFYFENPSVCLIFNAGELSLIEYGENNILSSVRTEFANPHLISVRLNERSQAVENKKLAYLLDLKTICIVDLMTGITIGQVTHDSKIDWLELSETAHKLLFRDKKQRLMLVDVGNGEKLCILSGVGFVQWVVSSDVAVAQAGTNLAVWYNIDLPENPTMIPVKGEIVDIIRDNGKTEAVGIDVHNRMVYELDEGLVEFGTAIHDNDYGRAVLFLETIGDKPEAEAMWHNLASIALNMHNLKLAERCYAALGNVSKAYFLRETIRIGDEYAEKHQVDSSQCAEVWARLAILNNDLDTAENIYLEQGDMGGALEMYKKLHKWEDAIRLAERRGYSKLNELKEEYRALLIRTNQDEKAGLLLEQQGNYEQAISLYLRSNRPARAAALLNHNLNLMSDETVVAGVLKSLIKNNLYEQAAEVYDHLNKSDLALECYRKGKVWNKAVDLARMVNPELVVVLEEEWGDGLMENKQMDAAINHYIEAGKTRKALDAAIAAKQWKKAVQIVKVIDDPESIKSYYEKLGKHFASVKDYATAEKMFVAAELYKDAVDMYNQVGQWEKAHVLAMQYLEESDVSEMYLNQAQQLENAGKFRDAEKLYLSVNEADLAIAMYKRVEQYDSMVRLVEKYHPDLLQTTHLHLGQQLENQGKHRAAEGHFLAAGEWKAAMNMYRGLSMWEEAYRVAKQNSGTPAANQVAFLWSRTLPIDPAIKLLNKYGILEACIDYACEIYQFDFAFQLCKNLPSKVTDVHYKYAMALEDDGKFSEAETEFLSAGKPKEAILMYTHSQDWMNALRIAEAHEPTAVTDILQAQALQCFEEKQFTEFETLLLRAQTPELIVSQYKKVGMWVDALRVCKDFLPALLPILQAEYSRSEHNKTATLDVETLLSRANEWAIAGQHKQAIDCLLQVNSNVTDQSVVRRALLRAADMVNKFLIDQQATEIVLVLAPRLLDMGENTVAAQLYISVDMMKEAIDCFIVSEDWTRARKVAKELEPAYESYVESKYKDRLRREGNIEQLADIDIIGALDLLAEQGQWMRCLEKAKLHSSPVLHKYVALYASQLLKDGFTMEALALYNSHGTPAMSQNFNIYTRIALDVFSSPGLDDAESYSVWMQLRQMLYELNEGLEVAIDVGIDTKMQFRTLLFIAHLYATRSACRQVPSLQHIAVKISTALLRYTDIIPADKGFYEAGLDLRGLGRESEAFVFLNHYLDICDAIEEGEGQLVDHSDLGQTDFPSSIPLPEELYLKDERKLHDDIREWVLAISMDQRVDQSLPIDSRNLYESCLSTSDENPCIVTGYPVLKKHPVIFQKSDYQANRESWSKLTLAAKMSPQSNVPNVLSFIEHWCGTSNYILQ